VRDTDTAAVVRVMTVHKSKGLGFDLVVLPDLEGTKLAVRRRNLALQRSRNRAVEWVLDLPTEMFHAQDEVLRSHVAAAEADACYEQLAVLYVAMTRAKRAMYLITEPTGTSQSLNFPRLLRETLGEECAYGDAQWFDGIKPAVAAPELGPEPTLADVPRVLRRSSLAPSDAKVGRVSGRHLFALDANRATGFGRLVHGLLAKVEWGGEKEARRLGEMWRKEGAAGAEALSCVLAPELLEVWTKPESARADVWRERAFEIVLDGMWVTGVFDRVVICYDEGGGAIRAQLYDFKTDRGVDRDFARATVKHEEQLALYRRVVAKLTGLPAEAVSAEVVFTEVGRKMLIVAPT
jgi:ATP-dependent helicase/nuclease subunit A